MRLFLTLCSLAAVAFAKPQYNYGAGLSGSLGGGRGFLAAPSLGSVGGSSLGGFSSGGFSSSGGLSGFHGGSSHSSGFQQSGGYQAPVVHKQFYTIAAPEDNDNLERSKHLVIGRPQKNYRVVFIKAPSSNNANVRLSAEYAPQEEKTAIYVLTKKDAALEINDIATPAPTAPSKPEVFFIKYKTEEEAQHAQRTIQSEYDRIEGTSEHTDGGVAPVQSVIGSLDGGAGVGSNSGNVAGAGAGLNGGISSGSSGFGNLGGISSGAQSPTYLPPGK